MIWLWLIFNTLLAGFLGFLALWIGLSYYIKRNIYPQLLRIFQEKPLFVIPRGQPQADAEEVSFPTTHGLQLLGCYFRTHAAQRRGVILFGLEFGSNRWACLPYCQFLRDAGFDIFTFEPRSQGDSDKHPDYEPLQWVTAYEVSDMQAALTYLRSRPDADPRGIGFFGISKGGGAGIIAFAKEPYVRCFVTDGIFGTFTTMVPYMRRWIAIYSKRKWLQHIMPDWYYGSFAAQGLRDIARQRQCYFPSLERCMRRLSPRPLLMIHGGADTYIKPEMAQSLYELARQPKELWLVAKAKHNQALHKEPAEYQNRVLGFFDKYLAPQQDVNLLPNTLVNKRRTQASPLTAEGA